MKLIKTIRNWLKAKRLTRNRRFSDGYVYAKEFIHAWRNNKTSMDELFCAAYSEIFVCDYYQGVRKALCEYYQEQFKNEK